MTTQTGTIKYINDDSGFGFIKKDGGGPGYVFSLQKFSNRVGCTYFDGPE
jgi:hypothetical protein